jgi:importin subunit alpha-6/7
MQEGARKRRLLMRADSSTADMTSLSLDALPQLISDVASDDAGVQLHATTQLRQLLSCDEDDAVIDAIVASGFVLPRLVHFLGSASAQLQFEATSLLVGIASGSPEHARVVIDANGVPPLVQLLRSPHNDVREMAIWALGNIACDAANVRDYVLSFDAIGPLLDCFADMSRESLVRIATWALSCFCSGTPAPPAFVSARALPVLATIIHSDDAEVLADACWALSFLCEGAPRATVQAVINAAVLPRVAQLLVHPALAVTIPALRCVRNIAAGGVEHKQAVIDSGALAFVTMLLASSQRSVRNDACRVCSNIAAGTQSQVQAVIDAEIVPMLLAMMATASLETKSEACGFIVNVTNGGSLSQIEHMVQCDVFHRLNELLGVPDATLVLRALECLPNVFRAGVCAGNAEGAAECVGSLDDLGRHRDAMVRAKAAEVLARLNETAAPASSSASSSSSSSSSLPKVPQQRLCSKCKQPGHNARTCRHQ